MNGNIKGRPADGGTAMTTEKHTPWNHPQEARAITRSTGGVDVVALGWSLSIFFAGSVLLCAAAGFVLPAFVKHLLATVFPVFDWRSPQTIALATAQHVSLRRTADGKPSLPLVESELAGVAHLAVCPNDRLLAAASSNEVRIWRLRDGGLQRREGAWTQDIRALATPVLRHRILLNYRAEADGVTIDKVIAQLLDKAGAK